MFSTINKTTDGIKEELLQKNRKLRLQVGTLTDIINNYDNLSEEAIIISLKAIRNNIDDVAESLIK